MSYHSINCKVFVSTKRRIRNLRDEIYQIVSLIPCGKVATYGQISAIVGSSPRQVGYAMAALKPDSEIPWHRGVNRLGKISVRSNGIPDIEQERRLQDEGICFNASKAIDLSIYGWERGT